MSTLEAALERWRANRMALREDIVIEDGQRQGDVMDPWQAEDYAALDDPAHRHAYLERPRGHSKTGDVGTEAVCELVLGPPGQQLFCVAADEDQARLLHADVAGKFGRTPALAGLVQVTRTEIRVSATGSVLRVLAADAPSAYGLRPDWLAADELVEWRGRAMWDALWSATGKRPNCRVRVMSTAGWDRTSLAWEVRRIAESEADWYFSSRGQCASWISQKWLAQQERSLPPHVFARLHLNQWVEGVGAFLNFAEVDSIFGEVPEGSEMEAIGLDVGLLKDRTVVSHLKRVGDVIVVEALHTRASHGGVKVDLLEVEEVVAELALRRGAPVILDPHEAVLMAQRLRARSIQVIEYTFTSESRRRLFSTVFDLVRAGRLRARPHEELRRELLGLEVQETGTGFRVDHQRGRHDDHVVAMALAAGHLAVNDPGWFQRVLVGLGWRGSAAPAVPVATVPLTVDKLVREAEVSAELRRQREEDDTREAQRKFAEEQHAKGLAQVREREEARKRHEVEEAAELAKARELEAADERRLRRGRDPRLWSRWGG